MLASDKPFFISPPFGSYIGHPRAYSVRGSYTRDARPGRLRQILRTVRPLGYTAEGEPNGWVNKVGLRNPGWNSLPAVGNWPDIISLSPFEETDWHAIERWLDERGQRPIVEINVSCPNIDEHPSLPSQIMSTRLMAAATIVWKLPPLLETHLTSACWLADLGAKYLHFSNTLPSQVGGISGRALREVNLEIVGDVCSSLTSYEIEVIAGGGIYTSKHLQQYRDAGATRFSLSTAWFWPPRALRIMREFLP